MPDVVTNTIKKAGDWRNWLRGLLGGAIGGGANAITLCVADPQNYNIYEGFTKLWHVTVFSALVSAALFLKNHPLPDKDE